MDSSLISESIGQSVAKIAEQNPAASAIVIIAVVAMAAVVGVSRS